MIKKIKMIQCDTMPAFYTVGSHKVRSSLLFDHSLNDDQLMDSLRNIQQSVSRMCQISQVDVRPQLPALFTKFVRQMRSLDTRALHQLYTSTTSAPCLKARCVLHADVYATSSVVVVPKYFILNIHICLMTFYF